MKRQHIASMVIVSASIFVVALAGTYDQVAFMLNDSTRFPNTNEWGYATFRFDTASDTFKAFGDASEIVNTCHTYHTFVKARDFVFTSYAKR